MRIRTLEITGFKSFSERVVLAFDRGVSAIVGPNGCGKSNIVDAIRWVMGEQNPRHLRGGGMEDVIFNGTESTAPVGMAEVVLCFDNSDGLAPAPYQTFAEIEVARRLYRSGESEYLINRTQVRLRDVTDFFMDTGIGTRGYTIVEQGKISELVSDRPEDRRFIFEEAAGISKYRQRRRESERKLLATEQNLLRVSDVLGELRRQIGSLDRQARRATRFKELSARQRDLELVVSWEEFQTEAETLASAGRALEEARAEDIALDARVSSAESRLEAERRANLDGQRELERSSGELHVVAGQIQSLEARIEWEKRERGTLGTLIQERQDEIEQLRVQLVDHQTRLSQTIQGLSEVEQGLATGGADLQATEADLRTHGEQLAALQGRRDAVQSRLVSLSADAATLESRAEALEERRGEIELQLRGSEEALETNTRRVDGIRSEEQGLEARLRRALTEKDELGRRLGERLREQVEAAEKHEAQRRSLAETRERLQQVSARLETLREAERRESMRVAETLSGLPDATRSRVRGMLSDVLRVDDGVEAALEAVLVGRLDAVLVDNADAAIEVLEALRKESAGRATALSMEASDDGFEAGIVPLGRPLIEFVTVDERHRGVVQRLLRGIYLVDDLAEAVRRYGIGDPPAVFVTRHGEILDRSGSMTGGTGAPAGAISLASEIRHGGEESERLETLAQASEIWVAEQAARVAAIAEEVENTRNRHHTAELAVVNLEKDLERARERGKAAIESTESSLADKERLLHQVERVQLERDALCERLDGILDSRVEAESSRDRLQAETSTATRELDRGEQRVAQMRVDLARLAARGDQLTEKKLGLESQIRESGEWLTRRGDEVERARTRSVLLKTSSEDAARQLDQALGAEETLRVRQGELRERYEGSSRRVEELEGESRAASTERDGVRSRVQGCELALQEARMHRDRTRERIIERYDVDLDGYEPSPEQREGDPGERERTLERIRTSLQSLGEVNLGSIEEYEEVSERHRYLDEQKRDLEVSIERLRNAIARINRTSRRLFRETFEAIDAEFRRAFPRMFRGGRASLSLTDAEDILDAGIEITAQPPGKKLQNVNLLSGGEKALTAISLLMSVFTVKPSPFFLLDEVDAALDDANVGCFDEMLRDRAADSQFLVITHNKASIECADTLYGITMQEPGISKIVTVDLVS